MTRDVSTRLEDAGRSQRKQQFKNDKHCEQIHTSQELVAEAIVNVPREVNRVVVSGHDEKLPV